MIVFTCRLRTSISSPSTSAGTREGIPVPITRSSVHARITSAARIWNTVKQHGLYLEYSKTIWVPSGIQQNNMGYIWNTAEEYGLHLEYSRRIWVTVLIAHVPIHSGPLPTHLRKHAGCLKFWDPLPRIRTYCIICKYSSSIL